MDWLDEYLAAGGGQGCAARELCRQLIAAKGDHPFAVIAAYMRENDPPTEETLWRVLDVLAAIFPVWIGRADFDTVAAKQPPHLVGLTLILLDVAQRRDEADPLAWPAQMAAMRGFQLLVAHVAKRYLAGDDPRAGEYPKQIEQYALMQAGEMGAKAAAGRQKGKSMRAKVLALWEKFTGPKNNAGAAAHWIFAQLGGKYNADGNKTTPDVPSERTIREYINDYLKGR